jgi:predicted RNA-binding protein with PUA-like domain
MPAMATWLVKTEPDVFSIDDFARARVTDWNGVRNYQARNFLMSMEAGDDVLIYHSNAEPPGVVGLATVHATASPDKTQFDPTSEYFDGKASTANPRWFCPDLKFVRKFARQIPLDELRRTRALEGLTLLQKGSRLSVIPVSDKHFDTIVKMASQKSPA